MKLFNTEPEGLIPKEMKEFFLIFIAMMILLAGLLIGVYLGESEPCIENRCFENEYELYKAGMDEGFYLCEKIIMKEGKEWLNN